MDEKSYRLLRERIRFPNPFGDGFSKEYNAVDIDGAPCPYVQYDSELARRLIGLGMILQDLDFSRQSIEFYLGVEMPNIPVVFKSIWIASIMSYAKCFAGSKGRGTRLHEDSEFKEHAEYLRIHQEVMNIRDSYVAHAGESTKEGGAFAVSLRNDNNRKKIIKIEPEIFTMLFPTQGHLGEFLKVVTFLIPRVDAKMKEVFKALEAEVFSVSLDELYDAANFPG